MEKDIIKNISLLRFYHKSGASISLNLISNPSLKISGIITDKNFIFGEKFIVVRNKQNQPIKVFVEDIQQGSIIPEGYSLDRENLNRENLINNQQGLDKKAGSKETLSSNKNSEYSDKPAERKQNSSMFNRPPNKFGRTY